MGLRRVELRRVGLNVGWVEGGQGGMVGGVEVVEVECVGVKI